MHRHGKITRVHFTIVTKEDMKNGLVVSLGLGTHYRWWSVDNVKGKKDLYVKV